MDQSISFCIIITDCTSKKRMSIVVVVAAVVVVVVFAVVVAVVAAVAIAVIVVVGVAFSVCVVVVVVIFVVAIFVVVVEFKPSISALGTFYRVIAFSFYSQFMKNIGNARSMLLRFVAWLVLRFLLTFCKKFSYK